MNNPSMNRREFQVAAIAAAAGLWTAATGTNQSKAATKAPTTVGPAKAATTSVPGHEMSTMPTGNEVVAMVMYPGMTALDFVGPQYYFSTLIGATIHHVAQDVKPILSDTDLTLMPTITMRDCPKDIDILFVPGGTEGTMNAMRNDVVLQFLADRGARAKRITSVCTGSMLLGAAGLLMGYTATSHWVTRDLLPLFGAKPTSLRYVRDRNRITGAGVTAGLDFGLALLAELRGKPYAEMAQLLSEYDPQPPFKAGNRATAPKPAIDALEAMLADVHSQMRQLAVAKGKR
jgi:cyclohexyl-isocyanide hydratase